MLNLIYGYVALIKVYEAINDASLAAEPVEASAASAAFVAEETRAAPANEQKAKNNLFVEYIRKELGQLGKHIRPENAYLIHALTCAILITGDLPIIQQLFLENLFPRIRKFEFENNFEQMYLVEAVALSKSVEVYNYVLTDQSLHASTTLDEAAVASAEETPK